MGHTRFLCAKSLFSVATFGCFSVASLRRFFLLQPLVAFLSRLEDAFYLLQPLVAFLSRLKDAFYLLQPLVALPNGGFEPPTTSLRGWRSTD